MLSLTPFKNNGVLNSKILNYYIKNFFNKVMKYKISYRISYIGNILTFQ